MSNPKIKVEADLSSFDAELNKLKSSIAQMGDQLKTSSGKAHFNFDGSQKELNALIDQADRLTRSLDKGNKTSAQYAKNLKAAQEAMASAAKVSAKLESAGDAKTSNASNYFREYSGELGQEGHEVSTRNAIQRDREKTQAKIDADRHVTNAKWASRAARFAGFVGGSVMGGGGGYANAGSLIGSMLPGFAGTIAGNIGGMVGGVADKYMPGAKAEQKSYSELTRMIGSTSASFEGLRDVVRFSVSSFAIANTEAAELAKNFVKLTGETGSESIGKAIGASVGMAQQFGISSGKTSEFFGTAQLLGSSKNSSDLQRITVQLAETARRGGVSPKLEEFLSSVTGMMQHSASNTLTSQSVGGYASVLANGTSLGYAGLSKTPGGVAELINKASATASAGGSQGEASKEQLTRALFDAFPDVNAMWHPTISSFGLFDDMSKGFDKDSALYRGADADTQKELLGVSDQLKGTKLFDVYANRAKTIGHGDYARELGAMGAMTGLNQQQASALLQVGSMKGGYGGLESRLDAYGIDKSNQGKYAGRYAELYAGGPDAAKNYYDKLKSEKTLSSDLVKQGDKLSGKDLEEFIYKKVVPSQLDDPGLQMQKAALDVQNSLESMVGNLLGVETASKDILLGILKTFDLTNSNPIVKKYEQQRRPDPVNISDVDRNGNAVSADNLQGAIGRIRNAKTKKERMLIGQGMLNGFDGANGVGYPENTKQVILHELNEIERKEDGQLSEQSAKEQPTVDAGPDYVGSNQGLTPAQAKKVAQARNPSKYDGFFEKYSTMYGVDPRLSKMIGVQESGLNPNAISNKHSFGIMQHNDAYWGERGLNSSNWKDPETNIAAGIKYYASLKKKYGTDELALSHYMGVDTKANGGMATKYSNEVMAEYGALKGDQLPEGHKQEQPGQNVNVNVAVSGSYDLNHNGQRLDHAKPIFTTSIGRPTPTSVN